MEDVENQNDPDGALSKAFAAQRPWQWNDEPNKGHTPRLYHAVTRGWVLSQILMRVDPDKRTVGPFLQDEVAGYVHKQSTVECSSTTVRTRELSSNRMLVRTDRSARTSSAGRQMTSPVVRL